MTKRLATMCFVTIFLIVTSTLQAQDREPKNATLNGISTVLVVVESLSDGAKALGLTEESIQTDVELKLRLAGMRVATEEEWRKLPGLPYLYVEVVFLATKTGNSSACFIALELRQNAILQRNGQTANLVSTWDTSWIGVNQGAQDIRNKTKDRVDQFLNAWLSVNPKK